MSMIRFGVTLGSATSGMSEAFKIDQRQQIQVNMEPNGGTHSKQDSVCVACGTSNWRDVPTLTRIIRSMFKGSRVVRCTTCGLGRIEPMPSASMVDAIYASSEYVESYDEVGESFVVSEANAREQLKPRFDLLDKFIPARGTILDIGASRGVFLAEARHRGWIPFGLEAGLNAIQYAKKNLNIDIQHGTLESASMDRDAYDCVHLSHVLEHMLAPESSLAKIYGLLKKGGVLVVEVPYEFGDLFDRFREVLLRRERQMNSVPSSHLYFFTLKALTRLVEKAGFKVLQASTMRRNHSYDSRLPLGSLVKRVVYGLEESLRLGPLIEIYARKE